MKRSMISYAFKKKIARPVNEAEETVRTALQKQGFGVLTRIDPQEKLREKIGVDFKKYIILGACNPPNAYAALQAEEDIGLMLPCNVVLYESEAGTTAVAVIRPSVAMSMIENTALEETAQKVENALQKVFDGVS
jgi:uncharacterized protein (DUF302 family)